MLRGEDRCRIYYGPANTKGVIIRKRGSPFPGAGYMMCDSVLGGKL